MVGSCLGSYGGPQGGVDYYERGTPLILFPSQAKTVRTAKSSGHGMAPHEAYPGRVPLQLVARARAVVDPPTTIIALFLIHIDVSTTGSCVQAVCSACVTCPPLAPAARALSEQGLPHRGISLIRSPPPLGPP